MRKRPNKPDRRGTVMIQFALGAVLLFGCVSFAVDVGYMCWARGQIQRTVDSSALAGASGLMSDNVEERVHEFAGANGVVTVGLNPDELNIVVGNWNGVDREFTPGVIGDVRPNAVRVAGVRDNLGLFFANVMGFHKTKVGRAAVAVAGAGRCAGIWGLEGITASGDFQTDSYLASQGPYGEGNTRPNGDICSCNDITANGGITVFGDAMYGADSEFIGHGSYEIVGIIDDHACNTPEVTIDWSGAAANNNNDLIPMDFNPFQGNPNNLDLQLNNDQQLNLPPGTYYFNSATVNGQASIVVSGPTTLYINGDADLTGGGVVNTGQDPSHLTIYAAGPVVKLAGNGAFYGAVIAPEAEVQTEGTFEAFGVVLGRELKLGGNAKWHVEEGLIFDLFDNQAIVPVLVK